jgi:hypothetical protein
MEAAISWFTTTGIGIVAGAAVTWLAAWWYYEKASKDLVEQAQRLRYMVNTIARGLDDAKWIECTWAEPGTPVPELGRELFGIKLHASAVLLAKAVLRAEGDMIRRDPVQEDG